MRVSAPDNCGNSPRSLLAIEIAINLAANEYDKIEQFLAEDFVWSVPGDDKLIEKSELEEHMNKRARSKSPIEKLDILTSISHGKYAAVSSRAHMSNGAKSNSHDLYEFTSAGSSARLRKVTSYVIDRK